LGANAPMGGVRADSLTVLDGRVPGADRDGPYDHPYHDRAILCAPGGHTWSPTGEGATRVGDLYPTFWQCHQFERTLSFCLSWGGLSGACRPGAPAAFSHGRATD